MANTTLQKSFCGKGSRTIIKEDGTVTCELFSRDGTVLSDETTAGNIKTFADRIRKGNKDLISNWNTLGSMPA